jgi:hypothetical protein
MPNSRSDIENFYCALRRDDWNGFWGVASAGMALIAGRIAYGARASQPSVSCGSYALDTNCTHRAEQTEEARACAKLQNFLRSLFPVPSFRAKGFLLQ